MQNYRFVFPALLAIAIMACDKRSTPEIAPELPLVAEFSIENPNGSVNEQDPVLLSNKSENAVSYYWEFGNGESSTEKQPELTYGKCGIYPITLTVTSASGATKTVKHEVTALCIFGGVHDK